jgi:hypothetical protein
VLERELAVLVVAMIALIAVAVVPAAIAVVPATPSPATEKNVPNRQSCCHCHLISFLYSFRHRLPDVSTVPVARWTAIGQSVDR